MSFLAATLKLDVKLQARSKLYLIGVMVAVLTGLIGRFLVGARYAGDALPILYLLSLGGTTYIFGASLILSEKSQGTLQALRTTPLTTTPYLASKLITLTAFAGCEGAILQTVAFYGVPFEPIPLVAGVVYLGVIYTLLGMGQVASHEAVTSFLFPGAMVVTLVAQLPAFYVLEIGPSALWYFVPTQGPLMLMVGAFRPLEMWQWLYAVGMSSATVVVLVWWAKRRFAKFVALQET